MKKKVLDFLPKTSQVIACSSASKWIFACTDVNEQKESHKIPTSKQTIQLNRPSF